MLLIHGAYHFWPKRVAFRNDSCVSCKAPRRSVAVRTFDVGHIFWIPLLPVGFWRHWQCGACGRKPHVASRTLRYLKRVALYSLITASWFFWTNPLESKPLSVFIFWVLRIGAPVGAIVLLIDLVRFKGSRSLRRKLAEVPAAADTVCPFWETPLMVGTGTRWSCPACAAVRY